MPREKETITPADVGEVPKEIVVGITPKGLAESEPFIVIRHVPKGWTFTVGGKPSHYYSTRPSGLTKTISRLLKGDPPGTVTLAPVKAGAGAMTEAVPAADPGAAWSALPTLEERVGAFLSRGKLGLPNPDSHTEAD